MTKMFDPLFFDQEYPGVLPSNVCALDFACGQSEPSGDPGPPAPPPPTPDPRTPIQKLLERFDLEEDRDQRARIIYWNKTELPANQKKKAELEREARKEMLTSQEAPDQRAAQEEAWKKMDQAGAIEVQARPPIAVDADADVHISESAIAFPRWHLTPEAMRTTPYPQGPNDKVPPDEYRSPMPVAKPWRAIETIDATGPDKTDPFARIVECIRLARSMIPEVPVKPKGKGGAAPAGTLGWVQYGARNTEGWMYVEDPKGEYGTWFQELIRRKYEDAKAAFTALSADPTASPASRMSARTAMRDAAACVAVANQEGAPSAINTYDGLVLSWGIGIAGPGKLPKTFYEIIKDPRVYKALYLCGFRFDGTLYAGDYHGAYQIVDLTSDPPAVVYRDQWSHKPGAKPWDFEGNAYKVLRYVTLQPELLRLLIQLAKDPLTRGVIFEPNYRMIQSFVSFTHAEEIHTEALHIFVAQVKHNWGQGMSLVPWAISRFDSTEKVWASDLSYPGAPLKKDEAIAKGVVRFLMGRLQEQRWQRGVKLLELEEKGKLKDLDQSAKTKFLYQLPATTEYGFKRLMENYWKPMQKGTLALDGSSLKVADFPVVNGPVKDHYVWVQEDMGKTIYYDLGHLDQFDLLFPHEEIKLIGFEDGLVVIEDGGQRRKVPRDLKPTRGGKR